MSKTPTPRCTYLPAYIFLIITYLKKQQQKKKGTNFLVVIQVVQNIQKAASIQGLPIGSKLHSQQDLAFPPPLPEAQRRAQPHRAHRPSNFCPILPHSPHLSCRSFLQGCSCLRYSRISGSH